MIMIKGNTIMLSKGDDAALRVNVGKPLRKDELVVFTTSCGIQVKGGAEDYNEVLLTIPGSATANAEPGEYVWDVALQYGGTLYHITLPQPFILMEVA